ncbi:MAG: FAD-dependent oxidoreductase [Verrucomicrobiota bacterium]
MRFPCRSLPRLLALVFSLTAAGAGAASAARKIVDTDVCIYGATSGGVAAAAQAARHGLRVVLLDSGHHIGGMTTGGLGSTDKGNADSIGGISREFYQRIGNKYGTGVRTWLFEPKVAAAVFTDLLAGAKVTPMLDEPLTAVRKTGPLITEIETATGLVVRAGMFMDTTYEGDLLAAAGVSFKVGRESNAAYNETLNGVIPPTAGASFSSLPIDPYKTPGNPASGLLEGISPGAAAAGGTADDKVQAYNFRLCFTQAANRIPIAAPPNYKASDYELLGRFLAAKTAAGQPVDLGSFENGIFHNIAMPNGKSDWNANKGLSSDWIGHSHEWPTATPARRLEIAKEHENYIRGLFEFLRTDPRVPAGIRTEVNTWGLPPDEYITNANWSPQLYVREARRMIGSVVLTEAHGKGKVLAPQPVALGSYAMDSHFVQRFVVDGLPSNEGGFFVLPPSPWPIGLGALTPEPAECANLLATFALSATHVAFASARMEPVFMMTSHSAATAAAVALSKRSSIQDVPYAELAALLKSDGQILEWTGGATSEGIVVEAEGPGGGPSSGWASGANPGFHGTSYLTDQNGGKGTRNCTFSPNLPAAGDYRVSLWWVSAGNRASNARVIINRSGGTENLTVDQRGDPDGNATPGGWRVLGTYNFAAGNGPAVTLDNTGTDGFVIADAVRFEPAASVVLPTTVSIAAHKSTTSETAGDAARIIIRREGPVTAALTIPCQITGSVTPGTDCAALSGSVTIGATLAQATLNITALPDGLVEGDETLTLTLQPGAAYTLASSTATITFRDTPFDAWRSTVFTSAQNTDALISAPNADPDHDGLSNLAESVLGGDPLAGTGNPPLSAVVANNTVRLTLQRSAQAADAVITIESSPTLTNWQSVPDPLLLETTESPDRTLRQETWTFPPPAGPRQFLRLKVSR